MALLFHSALSNRSEQHKPTMTSKRDWSPSSSFDHPLLNDLVECKSLSNHPLTFTDEQIVWKSVFKPILYVEENHRFGRVRDILVLELDYHLTDVPHQLLLKRLHRRWVHTRQSIENMSSDEIEIKLKYKRDGENHSDHEKDPIWLDFVVALDKKRQTAVSSMTKDERLTMAECRALFPKENFFSYGLF